MSDIKKIKDEYINKLKEDLDLDKVNQIKTDLFGNLTEAKSRLGNMSVEIGVTYTKPYSESNHAKKVNYYGKEKANQLNNL